MLTSHGPDTPDSPDPSSASAVDDQSSAAPQDLPQAAPQTPTNGQPETDEQLVARLQQGDEAAYEELVERYRNDLYRFLVRFTSSRSWAEDVFQDSFFQVYQSAHTFDVTKRFKPWLFKIAANKARDQLRKNKRRKAVSLNMSLDGSASGGDGELVDLMEGDWESPVEHTAQVELGQTVRGMVDEMPDHLREVLIMAYFQQMPYRDVADALGIPLGTVKSRLHAAVGTFSKLWKNRHGEKDPLSP